MDLPLLATGFPMARIGLPFTNLVTPHRLY